MDCGCLIRAEKPMKFSLKYLLGDLFGAATPISPIRNNRARPLVELLEDRLVPFSSASPLTVTTFLDNNVDHFGLVSLRDAIHFANINGNPASVDTIQFAPTLNGKTIKLAPSL